MQPEVSAPDLSVGSAQALSISGLSHSGEGVGRLQGAVCFVPGALPGETVRVRLRQFARRHWRADLEAILDRSPERRRPPCILADHCGGCSLQHWHDDAQSRWKQQLVHDTLQRIGQLRVPVEPILVALLPLGYRNRATIPLRRGPDGRLRAGYFRRGSHRIVNLNRCPVLDPRIDQLIAPIKHDLEATGWPADCDAARGGGLRHLALRLGHGSGEVLVTLVSSHDQLPGLDNLAERWMARWPALVGVALNLQPAANNLLMGETTINVRGRSWLQERFADLSLRIGADTFFQVNTAQAERVLPLLRTALGEQAPGTLIDAYCGIGTYSLPLARLGWTVLGLERSPAAVRLARLNASDNGLASRCRFEAVDVAVGLADRLAEAQALFVDPPRKGLEADCLAAIAARPPALLLYLSCNPATLARDLAQLNQQAGYAITAVRPIDFFPQTSHVETLAVLRR